MGGLLRDSEKISKKAFFLPKKSFFLFLKLGFKWVPFLVCKKRNHFGVSHRF
jgi:hypothetical protein